MNEEDSERDRATQEEEEEEESLEGLKYTDPFAWSWERLKRKV